MLEAKFKKSANEHHAIQEPEWYANLSNDKKNKFKTFARDLQQNGHERNLIQLIYAAEHSTFSRAINWITGKRRSIKQNIRSNLYGDHANLNHVMNIVPEQRKEEQGVKAELLAYEELKTQELEKGAPIRKKTINISVENNPPQKRNLLQKIKKMIFR